MAGEFEDLSKTKSAELELKQEKTRFRVLWVLIVLDILLAGYFVFEIIKLFN